MTIVCSPDETIYLYIFQIFIFFLTMKLEKLNRNYLEKRVNSASGIMPLELIHTSI